jgi:hypothetical protein
MHLEAEGGRVRVDPLGAGALFGFGLAAYGKTAHDSPLMLQQEEG